MYTTDIQDGGTVSATDDERLPPGGFSLRHGFPSWFGRANKSAANSRQNSGQFLRMPVKSPGSSVSGRDTPESATSSSPTKARNSESRQQQVSTYEVLAYMRSTFDNSDALDMIPLEAAGNPGAWHAWRSHRLKSGKAIPLPLSIKAENIQSHDGLSDNDGSPAVPEGYRRLPNGTPLLITRKPGEWNWEGVWEVRVKKGVEGSLAESVLFGNTASSDDLIRFLNLNDEQLQTIKADMVRSLEAA